VQRTVTAHGLKLFVREQGAGHPLLMINGIGTNSEMWGHAERILATSSRTIVFDSPGTGRSETPLLPRSIPALARIVLALLDELGHEQVDVLGFSFGGVIAQQLAKDSPARIRRLALVSTFCGWGGSHGDLNVVTQAAGRPGGTSSLGLSYQLWALAGWSSLAWLSKVQTPTLVLAGGNDRLVPPRNAVQLARSLPNSTLHLLPDAAHHDMFDEERGGALLLADFFSSPSLAASVAWSHSLLA
jgi:poly(3-hydroxyoctanoate) depolymerase